MSVAVVSPGLLPIPPVIGGSVETVIQKMAETVSSRFKTDIYGPAHPGLSEEETCGNLRYYRFPAGPCYFRNIRFHIRAKQYPVIQVENRPLFISRTIAGTPRSKYVCSLHTLAPIDDKLISPDKISDLLYRCASVLVYSRFMRDKLAGLFPHISDKLVYIHLGADPDMFRPRQDPLIRSGVTALKKKLQIPANHKVIVFTGRVIPQKGVHILVQAMPEVLKEFPDCCLVVVGSGWFGDKKPYPYIKSLHQQALGIARNIRFTNFVEPETLPYYFALADVFVCPSQWDEPFGLVNAEAMAAGVPVVASYRGGIPEIVDHGANGFLVRNDIDPFSFVKPVVKLLRNPELAGRLGANGRAAVEKYFNWERAGNELLKLYEELLANT